MERRSVNILAPCHDNSAHTKTTNRRAIVWVRVNTRLIVAAIMLVGWVATPAPGFAQQTTTTKEQQRDWPIMDSTPCVPETVQGTGQLHTLEQVSPTTFRFKFHEFGNLTGASTGAAYQYQNHTENYVESNDPNFDFRFQIKKHIIRKAAPKKDDDDYFQVVTMREKIRNGVPVIETDTSSTECR
jgi:hypothetical protein